MANNRIQVKRTSVSGRTANVTNVTNSQYIAAGELALNMPDGILYSSNGSALITVGANLVNQNITGNLTVKAIIANGSIGSSGQTLTSNGSAVYWATGAGSGTVTQVNTGNGMTGGPITTTGTVSVLANTGIVANSTGTFVNATYIGTLTANNTSFVGSVSAANVVSNAQLSGNLANYQTTAGLATNVATLTSNNATFAFGKTEGNLNVNSAAQLTTARNIGDVSFNGTAAIVPERIYFKDTRGTNYNPFTHIGTTLHLKTNTTDGLVDGGTYHGVLDLAHWSDASGGVNHQLGLTDNGNVWIRYSTGASTWSSWVQLVSTTSGTANNSTNLNGQAASFYTNASNISTGTLPNARLSSAVVNTSGVFTRTGVTTFSANVILGSSGLSANDGFGTAGQVLTTNGTATYWASAAGGGYYKGGSAAVGSLAVGGQNIFRVNANTLNFNTTIAAGENAQATGPIAVAAGITLTVATGARVAIV